MSKYLDKLIIARKFGQTLILKDMKTSNLKCGKIINEIDSRIKSGEYKDFPATKNRLKAIQIELLKKAVEISDNDYQTLVNEKFI